MLIFLQIEHLDKMKSKTKLPEIEEKDIQLEAERISKWIEKYENSSFNTEWFIVNLLLNMDNINGYERIGILEDCKNTIREILYEDSE